MHSPDIWTSAGGERPKGDREIAGEHTGGGERYACRGGRQRHMRRPVAAERAARVAQEHIARGRRGRRGRRTVLRDYCFGARAARCRYTRNCFQ